LHASTWKAADPMAAMQRRGAPATVGLSRITDLEADARPRIVEAPHEILKVSHG